MTLPSIPATARSRRWLWVAAFALAVAAAGCNKAEPDGQVIAIANGEEITLGELNEEARARGLPIANNRTLRDSVIRDLVDRKLLVQEALRQKLDRTPEHLLAMRRLNEMLLSQELITDAQNEAQIPSGSELAQFIKAHPRMFDQRVLVSVDQIGFAPVADAKLERAIAAATTLDQVEAMLGGGGVARTRDTVQWDSATLTEDLTARLVALGKDRILLLPQGDRMLAVRVLSITPRALPESERAAAARDWIARQRTSGIFQQLLQQARSRAKVEYQPDFDPRPKSERAPSP